MDSVMLTGDAEKQRLARAREARKAKWEYLTTPSLVEAARFAKKHGWKKHKVQVRAAHTGLGEVEYSVEPFEKDCGCPGILKYSDFYD